MKHSAAEAQQFRQDWIELGRSWDAVAEKHGVTAQQAQKCWYNYHARHNLPDPAESTVVDSTQTNVIDFQLPETDHDTWNQELAALGDTYTVAFIGDLHVPDDDKRAGELTCKIVSDVNPDILTHGSDAFDFATIGRWDVDPDDLTTDAWQQINRPYLSLMRAFRDAAPNAVNPFLVGNHDERVYAFMTRQAPQLRYTVNQLFVDMIRKAGGLWLGWETTELQLPGLLLVHGTNIVSGEYPARRLANYCAMQGSALAGHVHRFDSWTKRGNHSVVTYQTSGCLCNLQPKWSHKRENWQHGITLVTVVNGVAFMEPVPFVNYKAVWGGKEYRA